MKQKSVWKEYPTVWWKIIGILKGRRFLNVETSTEGLLTKGENLNKHVSENQNKSLTLHLAAKKN